MRKKKKYTKNFQPDFKYNNATISRFVNYIMKDGKKSIAKNIVYSMLDEVAKKSKQNAVEVFEKALDNASPVYEVVSKRVGGANYQVPREVRATRKFFLACKWIIDGARSVKGKPMAVKLADEILSAFKNEGSAIKKKQNIHKMAEANRAFAYFK